MRDKIRVGIITFLITILCIIVFFNISRSESIKSYDFERNFSSDKILSFEFSKENMGNDDCIMFTDSDSLIAECERGEINIENNEESFNLYLQDKNFKNQSSYNIKLPVGSNRLLINLSEVYFTNKFKFYRYDIKSGKSDLINILNFKVISLRTLEADKLLIFGEQKIDKKFITGFFIYDKNNNKVKLVKKIVDTENSDTPIKTLEYSGNYSISENRKNILYYCDKYSEMYVFDEKGNFIKTIQTKDNAPLPKIITNSEGMNFYGRGSTSNTNMGVVIKDDKALVFSASNKEKFKIVIDEYSLTKGEYMKSYKLDYNNQNSVNIRNTFIKNKKLIIVFEYNYASFIFSRYK